MDGFSGLIELRGPRVPEPEEQRLAMQTFFTSKFKLLKMYRHTDTNTETEKPT
jgi:hypothetical protein